jgi:hypothetical protein
MLSTVITGLTNGAHYSIFLCAVNAVGAGQPASVETMPYSDNLNIALNKGFATHDAEKMIIRFVQPNI